MSTSPAEITKSFQENGYYLAKGVYSPAEVAELERDFDRIVSQLRGSGEVVEGRWGGAAISKIDNSNTTFVHTHNVQIYSSAWLRAFLQPRFIAISQAILGSPDVVLHHSKLFQKPAEKGAPFPMHQDWSYFPSVNDSMMAGIIHVSHANDEMGCLRVYPGSHRLGRKTESNGQSDSEDNWLKDYPIEQATAVEAEPGDVVFFHYFTLHGSMPNRSNKVRKTVLVQMHRGDDRIEDGNGHPNSRLALAGWNHHAKRSLGNQV
jgi:ectoine hydroxylase-related dioxygenase (phytanoyl-CoA dioxygenase family)